jgi:addiction module HigA family antidote
LWFVVFGYRLFSLIDLLLRRTLVLYIFTQQKNILLQMPQFKVVNKRGKEIFSKQVLHPGEILHEELAARVISQKEFADLLEMRPCHLNEVIKGKCHISALLALKLEQQLGISAAFWMRMQVDYDLKMAKKQLKVA